MAVLGSVFNYNSGGTAVLADILMRATKMPLRDFARINLFEPLGITDWEWVGDVHGRPLAFTGLRLRPRDMLKIARLVADRGQWQGRQVVPVEWIGASMQPRVSADFGGLKYGYQWWMGSVDWQGKKLRCWVNVYPLPVFQKLQLEKPQRIWLFMIWKMGWNIMQPLKASVYVSSLKI